MPKKWFLGENKYYVELQDSKRVGWRNWTQEGNCKLERLTYMTRRESFKHAELGTCVSIV